MSSRVDITIGVERDLYFHRSGFLQVITSGSAKLLGVQDRTGAIKVGLEADFVILGANPLTALDALKDIRMIVNDGKVAFTRP